MYVCGWIDVSGTVLDGEQELGFCDRLVGRVRDGASFRKASACAAERHLEAEPIAGHDLSPELRVVHTAKPHASGARCTGLLEQEHRRDLCERFDHQHSRHER
jgi:hypothetical protein